MSIALSCKCGQKFKAKDSLAGRKVKCPICSTVILVPGPQAAPQAVQPQDPLQPQTAADDPLGLGDDLLGQTSDPLATPTLPSTALPASRPSPHMAARPKSTPGNSGLSPLLLGLCIGGGGLLLLLVAGGIGLIWLSSGSVDDQVVADGGEESSTSSKVEGNSDSAPSAQASKASTPASSEDSAEPPAQQEQKQKPEADAPDASASRDASNETNEDASAENADLTSEEQTSQAPAAPTPQQLARAEKRRAANAQPRRKLGVGKPDKLFCLALADELLAAADPELGSDLSMNERINWVALMEHVSHGDHVDGNFRDYFIAVQIEREMGPNGFMVRLMKAIKGGGSYKLLRIHDVGDQRRALFRLIRKGSGFNYHDLIYEGEDEDISFVDWYDYSTGERYSDFARRIYLATVAERDKSLLEGLPGWEGTYSKYIDEFRLLGQSVRNQPEVTLDAFNGLAEEVKKEKSILWYRLRAAHKIGNRDEYTNALQDLQQFHPDDPSVEMVLINYYVRREEPEKAIEAINRLEKTVGGDPYLNVVRYDVHRVTGDTRQARKYYNAALRKDPSLKPFLKPLGSGRRKKTRDVHFQPDR